MRAKRLARARRAGKRAKTLFVARVGVRAARTAEYVSRDSPGRRDRRQNTACEARRARSLTPLILVSVLSLWRCFRFAAQRTVLLQL